MQILICDPDEQRAKMWSVSILKEFSDSDCQVHVTKKAENALAYINTLPTLDMIIAPVTKANVDVGNFIAKEIRQYSKSIQLILYGKVKVLGPGILYLPREPLIMDLIKKIKNLYSNLASRNGQVYQHIPIDLVMKLNIAPGDIYINLTKSKDGHYVKLFSANQEIDALKLKELQQKGLNAVWTTGEAFPHFISKTFELLEAEENAAMGTGPIDVEAVIGNCLVGLGVEEMVVMNKLDGQKKNLKKMFDKLGNNSNLQSLLKSDQDYRSLHGTMTGVISSMLLDEMTWSMPDQHLFVQIAALFMDNELSSPSVIQVRTQEEFDKLNLIRNEKYKLVNHAATMADKLANMKSIPTEISQLVRFHHGNMKGVGFDFSEEARIPSINWIFILAEECSNFILRNRNIISDAKFMEAYLIQRFPNNSIITKTIPLLMKHFSTASV